MPILKKHSIRKKRILSPRSFARINLHNGNRHNVIVAPNEDLLETRACTSFKKSIGFAVNCGKGGGKHKFPSRKKVNIRPQSSGALNRKICKSCKQVVNKKSTNKPRDNGGVNRINSPFNRFANSIKRTADQHISLKIPYEGHYRQLGLSPKEKSYVINSCQVRSTRYVKLKHLAANAVKNNKVFTIYGNCSPIRKALVERDWIEKIAPNKMNLSKIRNGTCSIKDDVLNELERLLLSYFVEKCDPNFIWRTKDNVATIDTNKESTAIVNKLKINAQWTSKQGLCSSMKRNYWFNIENIAEVNGPRSYNSYDASDIDGFVKDFRITACTSLLKWVISMVVSERPVFVETGRISLNVVVFALNRCKEYMFRKQNKDIDRSFGSVSSGQWNVFLKKYYRIISKDDVFTSDKDNRLPLYLGYAKFLLKEMHKYRPQLSCEGCHNIWIIKPANCSRGRGIRMASKLAVMTNLLDKANNKFVIQKYIEEPLLIHETKFDIRQYYLVTSTCPLVIWMYQDCYLKFSSQKYNLKNYHESIHLTNNAVQRKYKNCPGRHEELPQNNMWDLETYKDYLKQIGMDTVWDDIIYPGMKKSIVGIMLSCQDSLSVCKNRFELYGCDFILDKEYKPWLIEINSCPDLNATTHVTAKICPAVLSDIIKVVIDYANDPKSPTGKFECIYNQPMTNMRYGGWLDLAVRGVALNNNYFYKGHIKVTEPFDDVDSEKDHDIKPILEQLMQIYEIDVMEKPDDNCDLKKETCIQTSESECELSADASVMTDQSDEKVTEENYDYIKFIPAKLAYPSAIAQTQCDPVSEIEIKPVVKSSENVFTSTENLSSEQSFRFSQLEDGPSKKSSSNELRAICSLKKSIKQSLETEYKELQNSYNSKLQATSKIMYFINKKEKQILEKLITFSQAP